MENLHLKNINPNNIKHTKSTIKYMLLNTDIRHYKIEKFKQDYIEDLYYPLNNTENLISIGQEMIDIFNVLKDLQQGIQKNSLEMSLKSTVTISQTLLAVSGNINHISHQNIIIMIPIIYILNVQIQIIN